MATITQLGDPARLRALADSALLELERLHAAGEQGAELLSALADYALRANGARLADDVAALLLRLR